MKRVGKDEAAEAIQLCGVRQHNLRNLTLEIPRDKLVVVTGPSGSGKSSLAFDVLFAEGQRRYIDTLSPYARQFIQQLEKPEVDRIEGIPPAIAIEQRTTQGGSKTSVATLTEIWHFLRLLFARLGAQHCHRCGKRLAKGSPSRIQTEIAALAKKRGQSPFLLLAPIVSGRKGHYREHLAKLRKQGIVQARIDGKIVELVPGLQLDRYREHDIDAVISGSTIRERVERALEMGKGFVRALAGEEETSFSAELACPSCGIGYGEPDPRAFSFNSKRGWCPGCEGLGFKREFDEQLLVPDPARSLLEGAILVFEGEPFGKRAAETFAEQARKAIGVDPKKAWEKLSKATREALLRGNEDFEGLIPRLRAYLDEERGVANLSRFLSETECTDCHGAQLRPESLAVKVEGKSIAEVAALPVTAAKAWIEALGAGSSRAGSLREGREASIGEGILKELLPKLEFLEELGLGYLQLNRRGDTLSGGESQRIRLAASLGSHLTGVLYVLDEPTIGVHPSDHRVLLAALEKLRDRGNSVVVVEHDEETMLRADLLLDLGPGSGREGGHLVFQGTPAEIVREKASATGRALGGEGRRRLNARPPAQATDWIVVHGAREHNLKNLTVRFPVGQLTAVSGVSGSGKSTLVRDVLFQGMKRQILKSPLRPGKHDRIEGAKFFARVAEVDQTPIGRTPRSVPASYIGFLDEIRSLFSQTPESRARGYMPGRFSFNTAGGRCEACKGQGRVRLEMNFLPDAHLPCEVCRGRRFSAETLEVLFKGKNIAETLALTVSEAKDLFQGYPGIYRNLEMMERVGLGYLALGQESPTLSGGEAQRIKLVEEVGKWSGGKTLYLLDEPTTGLSLGDISKLIDLLHLLVERGDTVIVIEHNIDLIKEADWLIDLGPEGGDGGGRVVAQGHPLDLVRQASRFPQARTIPFLAHWFQRWSSGVFAETGKKTAKA